MTVSINAVSSGPYAAAAQTTFAVDFQSLSASEIEVFKDDVLVVGGYTFNRDPDGTGDVVFGAPQTGEILIKSKPNFYQPTEFSRFGVFYPDMINGPLDAAALRDQYLMAKISEAVSPIPGEPGLNAENPNYIFNVSTLSPGSNATLNVTGTYPNLTLAFGVPRGDPGASGALADATYSGIVVTGGGANLDVVAGHITLARMANLAANSIIGNNTGGAAVPAALSGAQVKAMLSLAKGDVGLGSVDNTSDASKFTNTVLTGSPTAPTAAKGNSSTQLATTAFVQTGKVPQVQTVSSAATVTPTFANDQVNITGQAVGLTLANPSGTAIDSWGIVIRIKDNGTARTIGYGTQYRAIGVTLPTTTVANKTIYLGMEWNAADNKWDVIAVKQEA